MYICVTQQCLFKRRLFALKKTLWNCFGKAIFTEEYTVGMLEAELLFGRNITQTEHRPYSFQIFITVVRLLFRLKENFFLFFSLETVLHCKFRNQQEQSKPILLKSPIRTQILI